MATKLKLTEAQARALPEGDYADTVEAGLYLYVTPTARTWGLYKWAPALKRPVRKAIGPYPLLTVDEARKRAKALSLKLLDGQDIKRPDGLTLDALLQKYVSWLKSRKAKTADRFEYQMRWAYGDWMPRQLASITRQEVSERHLEHVTSRGPIAAGRQVKNFRTLFSFADKHGLYDGVNVAKKVPVATSKPRQRFLTLAEVARLRSALDHTALPSWVRPYALLSLLTGARRANICAMRWDQLDLVNGVFTVPAEDSKNAESMALVLPPEAVALLRERQTQVSGPWVFPAIKGSTGHLVDPSKAVKAVYAKAGIVGATVHDLRRTLGSLLTQAGAPLTTVQRALGHKSPQTTARVYAVSSDASVREFMARLTPDKPVA